MRATAFIVALCAGAASAQPLVDEVAATLRTKYPMRASLPTDARYCEARLSGWALPTLSAKMPATRFYTTSVDNVVTESPVKAVVSARSVEGLLEVNAWTSADACPDDFLMQFVGLRTESPEERRDIASEINLLVSTVLPEHVALTFSESGILLRVRPAPPVYLLGCPPRPLSRSRAIEDALTQLEMRYSVTVPGFPILVAADQPLDPLCLPALSRVLPETDFYRTFLVVAPLPEIFRLAVVMSVRRSKSGDELRSFTSENGGFDAFCGQFVGLTAASPKDRAAVAGEIATLLAASVEAHVLPRSPCAKECAGIVVDDAGEEIGRVVLRFDQRGRLASLSATSVLTLF